MAVNWGAMVCSVACIVIGNLRCMDFPLHDVALQNLFGFDGILIFYAACFAAFYAAAAHGRGFPSIVLAALVLGMADQSLHVPDLPCTHGPKCSALVTG